MSHIISSPRTEQRTPRPTTQCRSTRRWSDRSVGSTLRQIALIANIFILYRQVRHLTSGDVDQAMLNADRIVDLERRLGMFNEGALQQLVLNSRPAIEFLDHYYVFVHFTVSFGFMAWVYLRRPEAWGRIRSWFLSVTLAGLVIHVLFPLAPPRMLSEEGFIDTLHVYGPRIYSEDVTNSAANQLAAMPSLHFAWAAIVAAGAISMRRSRWTWLVVLHPVITLLAIVATANHYWADGMVGGILVAGAITITSVVRPSLPAFARMPAVVSALRPGRAAFARMPAAAPGPAFTPCWASFANTASAKTDFANAEAVRSTAVEHSSLVPALSFTRVPMPVKAPAFAFSSAFASAARFAQGPVSGPLGPSLVAHQPVAHQPDFEPTVETMVEPVLAPEVSGSSLPSSRLRISRVSTITAVPVIVRETAGGRRHDLTRRLASRTRSAGCPGAEDLESLVEPTKARNVCGLTQTELSQPV